MMNEQQHGTNPEKTRSKSGKFKKLIKGVINKVPGEHQKQITLPQEENQAQIEKELLEIKELCESLINKSDLLLSTKGNNSGSMRICEIELLSDYHRAVAEHFGQGETAFQHLKKYLSIRDTEEYVSLSSDGFFYTSGYPITGITINKQSKAIEVDYNRKEWHNTNSSMIKLLQYWEKILSNQGDTETT